MIVNPGTEPRQRASIHTHGCRLNQAESLVLSERLVEAGYTVVPWGAPADLGILNTCTVTREAEAKCRQSLRAFIRRNPHAFTAVIGCYSQTGAREIAEIPGVDLIVGNQDKMSVLDFAREGKNPRPVILRERIDREDFSIQFAGETVYNKRANLKVQDGCDFMCSFCIIPFARGRARAREWRNLMAEARSLVERGVRELVLTGVNIGTFDHGGRDVTALVDALDAIPGLKRIRVSSIEPTTVPVALLDRMADPAHKLMPYLHLPLQSGCDRILQAMRRRYTVAEYAAFIAEAEQRVPGLCLGTDILVGFPGEREPDFEKTCRFFLEQPFAYAHVFSYSERQGTRAARHDDQVPVPERNRRSAHLRRLSATKRYDFYEAWRGREVEVLFEDPADGHWPGLTANYIRVRASHPENLANRRAIVRLERVTADFMEGTVLRPVDSPGAA